MNHRRLGAAQPMELPPMTHDLALRRVLKAKRDTIWRCWTEPKLLKPWFIPKPHSIEDVKMDVRPGGRFFTLMRVDGKDYPNDGSYLHVDPQRSLVFTDMMLEDWKPVANPGLGFTAILTLADHPEGTEYFAVAKHRTPEDSAKHEAMGFTEGWGAVASQLEEFAQTLEREGR